MIAARRADADHRLTVPMLVRKHVSIKGPQIKSLPRNKYYLANARNWEYEGVTEVAPTLNFLPASV